MPVFGNMPGEKGKNPNKLFIKSSPPVASEANSKLNLVLRLQTLGGCCPITSVDIGTTQKYYFFKWATLPAALSLITALYFSSVYIIFITHGVFRNYFLFGEESSQTLRKFESMLMAEAASRGKSISSTVSSVYFLVLSVGIYEIVIIILNWKSSLKLAEFLNNWIIIEKQFSLTFPNPDFYRTDHKESGRYFLGRFSRFDIGLCFYFIFNGLLVPYMATFQFDESTPIVDKWLILTYNTYFCIAESLEDFKNVLIYESCCAAFERARTCIRQNIKRGQLIEANILAWRKLIIEIQGQCGLAAKCLMPMQLAFLCNFLASGTTCIFLCLNAFGSRQIGIVISTMSGAMFVIGVVRLYFKVLKAEKIAQAAAAIANDLIEVDSAGYTESALDQIQMTLDALIQNPSVINFGNYVILNKRLLLGMISQDIAYLIVLMQYNIPIA